MRERWVCLARYILEKMALSTGTTMEFPAILYSWFGVLSLCGRVRLIGKTHQTPAFQRCQESDRLAIQRPDSAPTLTCGRGCGVGLYGAACGVGSLDDQSVALACDHVSLSGRGGPLDLRPGLRCGAYRGTQPIGVVHPACTLIDLIREASCLHEER